MWWLQVVVFIIALVNVVTASDGIYNCIECKQTYKTLGGLQRHNKANLQDIRGFTTP